LQALQRVAQFGEQANILDGDHGLGGEGFKKRDLLWRVRARLDLARDHSADGGVSTHQWCGNNGAKAVLAGEPAGAENLDWIECFDVRVVARLRIDYGTTASGAAVK